MSCVWFIALCSHHSPDLTDHRPSPSADQAWTSCLTSKKLEKWADSCPLRPESTNSLLQSAGITNSLGADPDTTQHWPWGPVILTPHKNSQHVFLCYVGNSRRADTMNSWVQDRLGGLCKHSARDTKHKYIISKEIKTLWEPSVILLPGLFFCYCSI